MCWMSSRLRVSFVLHPKYRNLMALALWRFKRSEDATSKDTTTVKLCTYVRPRTAFTIPSKSDHLSVAVKSVYINCYRRWTDT